MNVITSKLVDLALPLLSAPIAFWLTQRAKKALSWIDEQNAVVKQAFAVSISYALNVVTPIIGRPLCGDTSVCSLDNIDYKVLVTWALAMAIHGVKTAKTTTPSGEVTA